MFGDWTDDTELGDDKRWSPKDVLALLTMLAWLVLTAVLLGAKTLGLS